MGTVFIFISRIIRFYQILILVHCVFSWIPVSNGILADIKEVIARICNPYLSLFRRFIPPMAGIDFSPMVAVLVLSLVNRLFLSLMVR